MALLFWVFVLVYLVVAIKEKGMEHWRNADRMGSDQLSSLVRELWWLIPTLMRDVVGKPSFEQRRV